MSHSFDGLESGRYSAQAQGCFEKLNTVQKVLIGVFVFLTIFFVGFGIGFGAGNVSPPIVTQILRIPGPPPPSPWWTRPPALPQPSWAPPANYRKGPSALLSTLSPSATWNYITYDNYTGRVFLGLVNDSLVAINVVPGTVNGSSAVRVDGSSAIRVPNTAGCNGLLVAGALGYCGTTASNFFGGNTAVYNNGIAVLSMSNLTVVRTIPIDKGVGVSAGVYDATNKQVLMVMMNGSIAVINSATGVLNRTIDIPGPANRCGDPTQECDPLEFIIIDPPTPTRPKGSVYLNAPMMNAVLQLDLVTLNIRNTFGVTDGNCYDPTGMAIDSANRLLFVGCADAGNPVVLVMNADSGDKVTSVPIGRGNDGVYYDARRQQIYASCGVAGNIAIIKQKYDDPSQYAVRESVFTKPAARTMAFDPVSGTLFTMASDGRYNPALELNEDLSGVTFFPNEMFSNTLEVLSFNLPLS